MKDIKVVFMGTPEFSVPVLEGLIENYQVIGVVSQPDRKVGRKQEVVFSPVKQVAISHDIPVFQPEKIRVDYEDILDLKPDIIITDIRMPEIDGLEMIEIINEIAAATTGNIKTKFIILSGYEDFEYARRAMRSGVQEYIVKPVDDEELYAALLRTKRRILNQTNTPVPSVEILSAYELTDKNNPAARNTYKAIELIHSYYIGGITIENAAQALSLSAGYLSRIFKQETSYTFTDYLTRYRIQKATQLLQNDSIKIYDVADLVGYTDPRYFGQIFKKLTGYTPKEYRELIFQQTKN